MPAADGPVLVTHKPIPEHAEPDHRPYGDDGTFVGEARSAARLPTSGSRRTSAASTITLSSWWRPLRRTATGRLGERDGLLRLAG